jgi:serine/threonine protein kinase
LCASTSFSSIMTSKTATTIRMCVVSWCQPQQLSPCLLCSFRCLCQALAFEYCNAGDLRRLVTRCIERKQQLSVFEVLTIATQLCDALVALKKAEILHGDVALRNVFLQWDPDSRDLCVKLGDFGLCRDLGDTKTVTGLSLTHQMSRG